MNLKEKLKTYWNKKPLSSIIIIALILRIIAAFFSQGYGMHDDHFIAIEEPWSWTQNKDYDGWLPGTNPEKDEPNIYSFFYPAINYFLFEGMQSVNIDNPKTQMIIIRLLLGLFSILTVYYGYKITQKYSTDKNAKQVGLLLAALWFMPFFAVRNLVEIVAIPTLMAGTWLILKTDYLENKNKKFYSVFFLAGILIGISLSIRYQAGIYMGGMGLALLFQKRFIQAIVFGIGGLISFAIIQGIPDYLIWGEPFSVMKGYIDYNLENSDLYGNHQNFLMYLELLPGLLLPPVGALLFFGFFLKAKKHLLVFLPSVLFLAFHTYFPNRQERFIFTIMPMVVLLGVIGWNWFYDKSAWWKKHQKLHRRFFRIFWVINSILLIVVTFTYSKKSRVEAMHYLYNTGKEINSVIIDDTGREEWMMLPVFYSGSTMNVTAVRTNDTTKNLIINEWSYINFVENYTLLDSISADVQLSEYVIFVEDINLDARVEYLRKIFPNLKYEAYIEPSFTDRLMKKMNPNNKNEDFYVYSTGL